MKTIIQGIIILTCVFGLTQCRSKKTTTMVEPPAEIKSMVKGAAQNILEIDNAYVWPGSTDHFRVLSAQISDKDSLTIEVEYGGGCKEHQFRLVTNGMLKKSMPAQCTFYLEHESNDDMCRAMLRNKLTYYIGNLSIKNETIVINLHDFDAKEARLVLNP